MSNSEPVYVQKIKKEYANNAEKMSNIFLSSYLSKGAEDGSYDEKALTQSLQYIRNDSIFRYPDGSVQIDGMMNMRLFWESDYNASITMASLEYPFHAGVVKRGAMTTEHHTGFSIIPWAESWVRIWHWDSNPKNWGKQICFTPAGPAYASNPSPRNRIPVHILFKKSISKHREVFRDLIQSWACSASRLESKHGKVPVILNDTIEFFPKVACFYVDFSSSGQISVNWLMMQLVRFSSVVPILRVEFTPATLYTVPKAGERILLQKMKPFEDAWCIADNKSVRLSVHDAQ